MQHAQLQLPRVGSHDRMSFFNKNLLNPGCLRAQAMPATGRASCLTRGKGGGGGGGGAVLTENVISARAHG